MASTWPAKNNYATGDVLTAANMNGVGDDLNDVYNFSGYAAGKNKILNSDFGIWQRGTTATVTGSAAITYLADRFFSYLNGNGTGTQSQQSFTAGTAPVSGYESQYFHRLAINTLGTTSVGQIGQRIEDVRTFAGQTITFSFWAKADSARSFNFFISQNFGSGGSSEVTTNGSSFSVTTSWTRFSGSVTLPSISGKTIGTSNYLQIFVQPSITAGFVLDTWGWQLETGSTVSPFQTATGTKQGELAACQRYYYRASYTDGQMITGGQAFSATGLYGSPVSFPVTMRTTPTAAVSAVTHFKVLNASAGSFLTSSAVTPDRTIYGFNFNTMTVASGLTAGNAVIVFSNNASCYVEMSSEL